MPPLPTQDRAVWFWLPVCGKWWKWCLCGRLFFLLASFLAFISVRVLNKADTEEDRFLWAGSSLLFCHVIGYPKQPHAYLPPTIDSRSARLNQLANTCSITLVTPVSFTTTPPCCNFAKNMLMLHIAQMRVFYFSLPKTCYLLIQNMRKYFEGLVCSANSDKATHFSPCWSYRGLRYANIDSHWWIV